MLSQSTLSLLSSKALAAVSNSLVSKASGLATKLSAGQAREMRLEGYTEVTTTYGGKKSVVLVDYIKTAKSSEEQVAGAASMAALAKTLDQGGQQAYDPASLPEGVTGSSEEISLMNDELSEAMGSLQKASDASESLKLQKALLANQNSSLRASLDAANQSLEAVQSTLSKRATGEAPNPQLNYSNVAAATESILQDMAPSLTDQELSFLQDTLTRVSEVNVDYFEEYVLNNIILPYETNTAMLDIIAAQLTGQEDPDVCAPIFDTVFGPPTSYSGKFILSEDGVYYDSRSGGIPYIAAQKINAAAWQLRYASNRGGKGELYGSGKVSPLSFTVFDYDYENDSGSVKAFYKYDDILRGLRNDRDLSIQDVSGKIDDLVASGYATSSAIVQNYRDSYAAIGYAAETKIKKRKKQLQVAALFGPFGVTDETHKNGPGIFYKTKSPETSFITEALCGSYDGGCVKQTTDYVNSGLDVEWSEVEGGLDFEIEYIERIPINDFRYLKEIGVVPELQSQKSAMLQSEDLDDTTNPIAPAYLEAGPGAAIETIPEMALAPLGTTDWINTSGDTDLTGTTPYIRTLDDSIVEENLVLCYNFLEPSGVVTPSSNTYGVRNYARTGVALDAKMVGTHASSIFVSGVTIPYLEGSLYKPALKYGIRYSHLPNGSYVRLPNNYRNGALNPETQELDNLMYNTSGWTLDFWAYVPTLNALTAPHRYRIILGNENSGKSSMGPFQTEDSYITAAFSGLNSMQGGMSRTRGMIIGFRDRGNPGTQESSGLEFVALPTVSQNDDRWGKSVCIAENITGQGTQFECRSELGFKVPVTTSSVSGYTVSSCASGFTHFALICDLGKDSISLNINGQFLASGNVSQLFATRIGQPLNIPSRITEGFFDGGGVHGEDIAGGNLPGGVVLTPWILGGGYTDGISHESPALFSSTFPGFLGTNTNDDYYIPNEHAVSGGPLGQHSDINVFEPVPGLGGYNPVGTAYQIPRSGLDGHVGSFKLYKSPLTKEEVSTNYEAQRPFFTGIKIPHRLL